MRIKYGFGSIGIFEAVFTGINFLEDKITHQECDTKNAACSKQFGNVVNCPCNIDGRVIDYKLPSQNEIKQSHAQTDEHF